ncbi:MAG: histidine kinase [Actinomycetes bacterium]
MNGTGGGEDAERPSPLRSTSMPTEPVVEPFPASWQPVERQMVDLFFDRVPFGLAVFDLDGRLQRCNRTWTGFYELYFGAGPGYTEPGRHINDLIPGNEAALEELFGAVRAGHVVRQAAHKIEIPGVTTYWDVVFAPLFEAGEIVGVLDVVTDATDRVLSNERLAARIRAFTSISAAMTVDQPLTSTLSTIRELVMSTTAATAVSLVIWQERPGMGDGQLTVVADPAFGEGYADAFRLMYEAAGDERSTADDVAPVELRRDARSSGLANPMYQPLHAFWAKPTPEWDDLVALPLVSGRVFFGELHVHLPAGSRFSPDDEDYLRAMADQAALAVENAALFAEQAEAAGTAERQRLARELHDLVSQALFSMTMHARTAERRLEPLGPEADLARAEVARLQELTKGALAEMRALIFELRPGALAEEGLGAALTKQAAAIAAREQVVIEVAAPPSRLPLSADAEEHLYRIALEAMHNAVKHARPHRIDVSISFEETAAQVVLVVVDDGIGFDTSLEHLGHLGLGTMRERATALRGTASVESERGVGTQVTVAVPVDAAHPRD